MQKQILISPSSLTIITIRPLHPCPRRTHQLWQEQRARFHHCSVSGTKEAVLSCTISKSFLSLTHFECPLPTIPLAHLSVGVWVREDAQCSTSGCRDMDGVGSSFAGMQGCACAPTVRKRCGVGSVPLEPAESSQASHTSTWQGRRRSMRSLVLPLPLAELTRLPFPLEDAAGWAVGCRHCSAVGS